MKAVPLSFDFNGEALRPDYVLKCSYGNDSIALIQFFHEQQERFGKMGKIVVLYNDTGFAAEWWNDRVLNGEKLVMKYGFIPCRTESIGMLELIKRRNTWPDSQARFCTGELKIKPTISWLSKNDPEGKCYTVCGVRREESNARASWPEWVEADEGRKQWSPLILKTKEQRDELILRAGWKPLPHRSRECKCVLANATDISQWGEAEIEEIEVMEKALGEINKGVNQYMFRPHAKAGRPMGIREVVKWSKAAVKKKKKPEAAESGCDSGYCTG